jgi:ferredoxin-NADP reductase/ferredoxin
MEPTTSQVSPTTPAPGAISGMGEMMGGMMGRPTRQFYPSLMEMPALTPETRQFIEQEAQQRLSTGVQAVATGEKSLHNAMAEKNPAAMQNAAARMREGLLQVESGAAALRALGEGREPRQIALNWFKGQLSLPVPDQPPESPGPLGLSWFHLVGMIFLGSFVIGTLLIQFARMRRIAGLVARLADRSAPVPIPPGSTPSPITPAVPPTPVTPGTRAQATDGSVAAPAASASTTAPAATAGPTPTRRTQPWSGTLRVAAIFRETRDTKTFRMMNPQGGNLPFTFLPGQFLTFSVEIAGKRVRRSYTIASSPAQTGYVEVTVKRQEHGAVSCHLHDHVAVGSLLDISAPAGRFTFTGERESIVLIAGGVGMTPMMSVIRYLTDISFPGDIFLLFGARSTEDFIFREELEYLQRRHPNLHIAATMSRAEGTAWMGPEGPISKEFIARAVPEIAGRHVHLCGPPPMMEAIKAELADLGVPKEQIETEAFGPAEGMLPPDSLEAPDRAEAVSPAERVTASPAPPPTLSPAARNGGNGASLPLALSQIRFTVAGKTGPLLPNQSVLEAAEAIGVDIDYSCRVGTCGTCKVKLLEGGVMMEIEEGLDPGDKELGLILACQAKSSGNLVVEA